MINAPKEIWIAGDPLGDAVRYIRADVVEGMIEAEIQKRIQRVDDAIQEGKQRAYKAASRRERMEEGRSDD